MVKTPTCLNSTEFLWLCQQPEYRDARLERTALGEVLFMSPVTAKTGLRNSEITAQLWLWNRQQGLGVAFDSSAGFHLPNGADRSPDASWVRRERWEALSEEEQDQFAPLCPDFVVELRSKTDTLSVLQDKMLEYQANGAQLGWLINPKTKEVEIYRAGQPVEVLVQPMQLSGEGVLPGFILDLSAIW